MIISPHEQGSAEWFAARTGIPTASNFSKIFTTAGKPASTRSTYMLELVAENAIGEKQDSFQSEWMKRGIEMEPEARKAFEFITDLQVTECGLVLRDDELVGASPDGLIGDDAILELKAPKSSTHCGYLLSGDKVPSTYFAQVHGQMHICDRDVCYFASYFPALPVFIVRVERDETIDKMIGGHLDKFITEMMEKRARLEQMT